MERISMNDPSAITRAAEVLRAGGVILYPTDTLYGLGADALSDDAVEKIYVIKGRDDRKPVSVVVADTAMAERFAEFNDDARAIARKFWPGPLTLVLKKGAGLVNGVAKNAEEIGMRAPNNDFCLALARELGHPYTTTSANKSGALPRHTPDEILAQLGAAAHDIDLVIDGGPTPERPPSTVVRLPRVRHPKKSLGYGDSEADFYDVPEVLREGSISSEEILRALS